MLALLFQQAARHVQHATAPIKHAAQQVIQVNPPPVYVNVPQPPAGMPEWEKTLISAGTGALLGIISSIAMEYVKPWIAKRQTRKVISRQLADELIGNLSEVDAGKRLLDESESKTDDERDTIMTIAKIIAVSIKTDRFDHFFEEQKPSVYEIDQSGLLGTFYKVMKEGLGSAVARLDFKDVKKYFMMASRLGRMYLAQHNISYSPTDSQLELAFRATLGARDNELSVAPQPPDAGTSD